jgi:hypothetical protein
MSEDPPPAVLPTDRERVLNQLRLLVVGLGAIVFVVSVCFSSFVWKLTRNTSAVAEARQQQLTQVQTNVKRLGAVATDLGNYSAGRPELLAIFRSHGMEFQSAPAAQPSGR